MRAWGVGRVRVVCAVVVRGDETARRVQVTMEDRRAQGPRRQGLVPFRNVTGTFISHSAQWAHCVGHCSDTLPATPLWTTPWAWPGELEGGPWQ